MEYEFTALPMLSHRIAFLCDRPEFCHDDYAGMLDAPIYMPAGSCIAGSFAGLAFQRTIKRV